MKTMIEIHALQNFAPSNLNRDDTGAPKDALFGGTRRARVSSQCLKRAVRQYFEELMKREAFSVAMNVAVRTKRCVSGHCRHAWSKRDEQRRSVGKRPNRLVVRETQAVKEDGKTQYLLFLGQKRNPALADTIHREVGSRLFPSGSCRRERARKGKKATASECDPKNSRKPIDPVFNGGKAVDVALFGRMLADMPEKNQNAACQVAHAISTHSVEREFDFYTAVDDLQARRYRRR